MLFRSAWDGAAAGAGVRHAGNRDGIRLRVIYLAAALVLDARFLYLAVTLQRGARADLPIRNFRFSITYLMALFGAFIADHYCRLPV